MRVLVVDPGGIQVDFALACVAAGHEVALYIDKTYDGAASPLGVGLVRRVARWQDHISWADITVLSGNGRHAREMERYKKAGARVLGCTLEVMRWEMDRAFGQKVLESCGVTTIPTMEFTRIADAIDLVTATMGRYVIKPNGDGASAMSYCSKGPADMVYMLRYWQKTGALKDSFVLQEFISGIEMAVGGWFNGHTFAPDVLENWEFKKLCNDDKGPGTGEMGTIIRYTKDSLLADKVLRPVEKLLAYHGYIGYIDVNCIIDKRGVPWPMEFSCRFGFPTWPIQRDLHIGDPVQWMVDLADGKHTLKVRKDIACGVLLAQPPFPQSPKDGQEVRNVPVHVDPKVSPYVHLCDVRSGVAPFDVGGVIKDVPAPVTAGTFIGVCTGLGRTVEEARTAAYKTVEGVSMPNSAIYRTDIGCRLEAQLPKLHSLGYADGVEYKK